MSPNFSSGSKPDCEAAFAEDLQSHPLLSNHSTWFRYTIVKNEHWYFNNIVLLGSC